MERERWQVLREWKLDPVWDEVLVCVCVSLVSPLFPALGRVIYHNGGKVFFEKKERRKRNTKAEDRTGSNIIYRKIVMNPHLPVMN